MDGFLGWVGLQAGWGWGGGLGEDWGWGATWPRWGSGGRVPWQVKRRDAHLCRGRLRGSRLGRGGLALRPALAETSPCRWAQGPTSMVKVCGVAAGNCYRLMFAAAAALSLAVLWLLGSAAFLFLFLPC